MGSEAPTANLGVAKPASVSFSISFLCPPHVFTPWGGGNGGRLRNWRGAFKIPVKGCLSASDLAQHNGWCPCLRIYSMANKVSQHSFGQILPTWLVTPGLPEWTIWRSGREDLSHYRINLCRECLPASFAETGREYWEEQVWSRTSTEEGIVMSSLSHPKVRYIRLDFKSHI